MKVLVINGSPKGKDSITFQTVRFLQRKFPKDDFEIIHAGAQIALWERDMSSLKEAVESARIILFAYPVYTFMAPSQLHRFITRMKEQDIDFSGKYALQITMCRHVIETLGRRYLQ